MNKKVILAGILLLVLTIGVGAGVYYGVNRNQDIRSKAAGDLNCFVKWASNCDGSLSPANGSTIFNLKPHFHWVYGGYDGSACSPSLNNPPYDCAGYGARVVLLEGANQIGASAADITTNYATLFNLEVGNLQMSDWARANGYTGSANEPNYLNELKPNTTYTWNIVVRYRPKAGCIDCSDNVHPGGPSWTFTTPSGSQTVACNQTCNTTTLLCSSQYDCTGGKCVSKTCPTTQDATCNCPQPVPTCDSVAMTPEGLTVTSASETRILTASSTGTGTKTYHWTTTGGTLSSTAENPVTWTAPATLPTVLTNWTISATVTDGTNQTSTVGGCTKTLTYTPPTPVAACQKVTANKDLTTLKIGDTVTFTGYGTLSNQGASDSIDKINFIILKDGVSVSDTESTTTLDSAGVWKATKDFTVTSGGSYSVRIRVHWASKNIWLE